MFINVLELWKDLECDKVLHGYCVGCCLVACLLNYSKKEKHKKQTEILVKKIETLIVGSKCVLFGQESNVLLEAKFS